MKVKLHQVSQIGSGKVAEPYPKYWPMHIAHCNVANQICLKFMLILLLPSDLQGCPLSSQGQEIE